ncbi:HAD family hydrolase [Aliikangiella sp. IMCC44653]
MQGIFFDLDGTLADTAPDLSLAINLVLKEFGKEPLPFSATRALVSGGSPALIKLAFNKTASDPEFENLKQMFLDFYEQNIHAKSKLFNGIDKAIAILNQKNIPWGIVTNKPAYLTQQFVPHFSSLASASVVISGDTYNEKKPHPKPLIEACNAVNLSPKECVYVGDDERDIIAANRANMFSVTANWGYLSGQDPFSWHADFHLETSESLAGFIKDTFN